MIFPLLSGLYNQLGEVLYNYDTFWKYVMINIIILHILLLLLLRKYDIFEEKITQKIPNILHKDGGEEHLCCSSRWNSST